MSGSLDRIRPLLWIAPAGLLLWIAFWQSYPWYDTSFSLAAAQDVLAGRPNGYELPDVPAFHPLVFGLTLAAAPLGAAAGPLLTALTIVAFAALCWAVFGIGWSLFGWPVGALAALLVYTSVALEAFAVEAYGDVLFAALVTSALLLEVRRPRAGWPVLALLAVAGLQRPEAWLLALAYWLYLFGGLDWRARLALAALVLAAPAFWLVSEALVAGGRVEAGAASAGASSPNLARALFEVPADIPGFVADLTRKVVAVGGAVGIVCALLLLRSPGYLLLATAALGAVALAVLGAAGQPVVARYAIVIAVIVALYCAVAALGWLHGEGGRHRRLWQLAGFGLIALLVATIARPVDHWLDTRRDIRANGAAWRDLRTLATSPPVRDRFRVCKPLYVPTSNPIPYLRFALDVPVGSVAAPLPADGAAGLYVVPRDTPGAQEFLRTSAGSSATYAGTTPRGATLVAENGSWRIFAGRDCAAAR